MLRKNDSMILILVAASGAALRGSPSFAAVLHDQRTAVVSGTWTGTADAYIGGFLRHGVLADHQVADDFILMSDSRLTSITVDFISNGSNPYIPIYTPAGGFLVELFPDAGGRPAEIPVYATTSTIVNDLGSFPAPGAPPEYLATLATYSIDISGASMELAPGTWWVSVTAVDETPFGLWYRQAGVRSPANLIGSVAHRRMGGADHGNGYSSGDWLPNGGQIDRAREISFQLNGDIIPAPATGYLACMLAAWSGARRRRRPAGR